jgi:SAM-dependent methyltransferase
MKKLDLGCGKRKLEGAVGIDISPDSDADVVHDLNRFPYPFPADEFDYVQADNVIEHLDDVVKVLDELHRITKNGAEIKVIVPFFRSHYAFIDPTHRHFFTVRSFDYFDPDKDFNRYYKYSRCTFRVRRVLFDEAMPQSLMGGLLRWFANKRPVSYETRLAAIFPLSTLTYYLETYKP